MTAPERIWVDEDTWFSKPVTYPNAVEYLRADVVEARLSDPVAVHANMLRGTIAKPTVEQIIHLYGREAFQPMIDAATAKALEKAMKVIEAIVEDEGYIPKRVESDYLDLYKTLDESL